MTMLIAAVVFFVGIHWLIAGTRLRDRLVSGLGEPAYLALFSLLSIAALAWMIWAYGRVRVPVPSGLSGLGWLALLLVFVAFVFGVLGLMSRSPTVVGGGAVLKQEAAPSGIHRISRHPFLWGVALWAATHMLLNPQPAELWFFGGFLLLALVGPFSIDAKRARRYGEQWARYAAATSNLPFLAIARGRNRLVWSELGLAKLAVAVAVFLALAGLHGRFFGVPAF